MLVCFGVTDGAKACPGGKREARFLVLGPKRSTLNVQRQICKKFLQFVSLMKLKNMEALRIEILNPKVKTILKQLADLDLIAISKMESPETELKNLLKKFRSKSKEAPTLDEITREIEVVRAERYAEKKD